VSLTVPPTAVVPEAVVVRVGEAFEIVTCSSLQPLAAGPLRVSPP
jgi:hypothetical protein